MNRLRLLPWCSILLGIATGHAQFPGQETFCNPIDIHYQYNFDQKARGISFRAGADPVIVNHHGDCYLFVTISGAATGTRRTW